MVEPHFDLWLRGRIMALTSVTASAEGIDKSILMFTSKILLSVLWNHHQTSLHYRHYETAAKHFHDKRFAWAEHGCNTFFHDLGHFDDICTYHLSCGFPWYDGSFGCTTSRFLETAYRQRISINFRHFWYVFQKYPWTEIDMTNTIIALALLSARDQGKNLQLSSLQHGPLTRYVELRVAHGNARNHRLQRKPLVSDPGMHLGTCAMHVPWCMSGSLTRDGRENVPGIPGACETRDFTYLVRGPWIASRCMDDHITQHV